MSTNNVVTHPRFAAVPVKNPPMRKGPKPKGCASYYAAKGKRDRERRLRNLDQARQAEEFPGVSYEVSEVASRLANALKLLDFPRLKRLVENAEQMIRAYPNPAD